MRDISTDIRFWLPQSSTPEVVVALATDAPTLALDDCVFAYHLRYIVVQLLSPGRALFGQMAVLKVESWCKDDFNDPWCYRGDQ